MNEELSPEMLAQLESIAMNNPHQMFVVDRALRMDVGAFTSSVTLGNTAPNGQILAVTTIVTSTAKMREIATSIIATIDNQSEKIRGELQTFEDKLPKK